MLTSSIHTVLSSWGFIFSHMGAQEIIDILLTSVLFFGVLFLLTKTKSIPVMMGVAMVVLLYGIALQLHFSLTLRILQSFIGALIVILAIVFQQELRRLFWLIGLLGVKGHRVFLSHKGIDTLTDSLWELAQKKVGALIILPGKESIEQYSTTGVDLDARISKPLLLNLFNTATPTHDGAIVIAENRIKKFSVYVPISKQTEALKNYGSRHRAALGLSEKTDALLIVVSEEKGTVSLARVGELTLIQDSAELIVRLEEFFAENAKRTKQKRTMRSFLPSRQHMILAAGSLTCALIAWFLFSFPQSGMIQRTLNAPIEFANVSGSAVVENIRPQIISITLSGKAKDFEVFDPRALKVSIDAKDIKTLGPYRIKIVEQFVDYPNGLSLEAISPQYVRFSLSKKIAVPQEQNSH